jgi:predicted nucleic acid-binding protein
VGSKVEKCRDVKDNFLLNLSIDGKADFLITGDTDLLVLGKIRQTQIVSWSDFISKE